MVEFSNLFRPVLKSEFPHRRDLLIIASGFVYSRLESDIQSRCVPAAAMMELMGDRRIVSSIRRFKDLNCKLDGGHLERWAQKWRFSEEIIRSLLRLLEPVGGIAKDMQEISPFIEPKKAPWTTERVSKCSTWLQLDFNLISTRSLFGAMPAELQTSTNPTTNSTEASSTEKPKLKICCACPETKRPRDECIVENGEDKCSQFIEAHKACLRLAGFQVAWSNRIQNFCCTI